MRMVLTIGLTVAILQQITGINSILYYAPEIFKDQDLAMDAAFGSADFEPLSLFLPQAVRARESAAMVIRAGMSFFMEFLRRIDG